MFIRSFIIVMKRKGKLYDQNYCMKYNTIYILDALTNWLVRSPEFLIGIARRFVKEMSSAYFYEYL